MSDTFFCQKELFPGRIGLWSGPDFADNKSLACVRLVQSVNQQFHTSNLPVLVWYLSKSFSHQSSHLSSCVSQQLLFPVFQFSHAIHLPNTASGAWHAITQATAAHHSHSNQSNRTLAVDHLLRTLESRPSGVHMPLFATYQSYNTIKYHVYLCRKWTPI